MTHCLIVLQVVPGRNRKTVWAVGDAAPPGVHVPAVLPDGGVGAGVDLSGDGATAPPLLLDHRHRILVHCCMYPPNTFYHCAQTIVCLSSKELYMIRVEFGPHNSPFFKVFRVQ